MSKLKSTFLMAASRLTSALLGVIAYRVYLDQLGMDGWGSVAWLMTLLMVIQTLVDPSITFGMQQRVIQAIAQNEPDAAFRVFNCHRAVLLAGGALGFVATIASVFFSPFAQQALQGPVIATFVFAGLSIALNVNQQGYQGLLMAHERFGPVASIVFASTIINTVSSITLLWFFPHPWAFFLGSVIGGTYLLFALRRSCKRSGFIKGRPKFDWPMYETPFKFGKAGLPMSVGINLAQSHRFAIERVLGQSALGALDLATRFPVMIAAALPLYPIFQPTLTRSFLAGEAEFARQYRRSVNSCFCLILAVLVLPTAFGSSLLQLWLGSKPELIGLHLVLVWVALDSALASLGSLVAAAFGAASKPALTTWIVLMNGVLTLVGTPVLLNAMTGQPVMSILIAVGIFRVGIQLISFIGNDFLIQKFVCPAVRPLPLLREKFLLGILGALVWAAGYALNELVLAPISPWFALLAAPLTAYLFVALCVASGLSGLPEKLHRFFPAIHKGKPDEPAV